MVTCIQISAGFYYNSERSLTSLLTEVLLIIFKRNLHESLVMLKEGKISIKVRDFDTGERVQMFHYRSGHHKWKFGTTNTRLGRCHYEVDEDGVTVNCHIDQMRSTAVPLEQPTEIPFGRDEIKDNESPDPNKELQNIEQDDG